MIARRAGRKDKRKRTKFNALESGCSAAGRRQRPRGRGAARLQGVETIHRCFISSLKLIPAAEQPDSRALKLACGHHHDGVIASGKERVPASGPLARDPALLDLHALPPDPVLNLATKAVGRKSPSVGIEDVESPSSVPQGRTDPSPVTTRIDPLIAPPNSSCAVSLTCYHYTNGDIVNAVVGAGPHRCVGRGGDDDSEDTSSRRRRSGSGGRAGA